MADQIPIKVLLDGNSCTCGLAQFVAADTVGTIDGGTGLATQGICEFAQPGVNAVACKSTYIGICAGKSEGDALDNTYAGHSAGTAVTTGCQHTIIGSQAGKAITTCSGTIAKINLVSKHLDGWAVNQHVMQIFPKDDVMSGYIYVFLKSKIGQKLIKRFT